MAVWLWRILGVLALVMALVWLARGKPRKRSGQPADYEAELIRLCRGKREEAERRIQEEIARSPELSRVGAAMAAVTRIRYERDGYSSSL
jgi:glucose-6-phosphate dehydrogenase assembly protein OpcA